MLSYMPSASLPLPNAQPDSIGTRNTHKMSLHLRPPTVGTNPRPKRMYLKATVTFILSGLLLLFLSAINLFERSLPAALVGGALLVAGVGIGTWRWWAERRLDAEEVNGGEPEQSYSLTGVCSPPPNN